MSTDNEMRAAEIEKQANNAQKDVMREKRDGLEKAKRLKKDASEAKNMAMYAKPSAVDKNNAPKQIASAQAVVIERKKQAEGLTEKAKQLEKQVLDSTRDKDFKIKQMYESARKLRTQS